jgi:predicted dehydrogenase
LDGRKMINFGVIGINHDHIYGQVNALTAAGATFVSFYALEDDLVAVFAKKYPHARRVTDSRAIYEDATLQMVVTAAIPSERAQIGLTAMRHDKDVMSDKPGCTSLAQLAELRQVQLETGRIYSIYYSEHLGSRSTVRAGELVAAGAIGKVVQTIGLGPHRTNLASRPEWFFQREKYGGILTDIASHQAEQFLFFTGSNTAQVVTAQVANYKHPEHPELEDWGELLLAGDGGNGYVRVDWYTPDGLPTWGDVRLTILGTEGYIELRKNCDIGGRDGGDHLFLVNKSGTHYINCVDVKLPYGADLVADVLNRTETALPQARCFGAMELVLQAQTRARRLGFLQP